MVLLGEFGRSTRSSRLGELRPAFRVGGSRLDGTAERARLTKLGVRALPQYPGTNVVPAVVISPPPLLRPDMSEPERVKLLATGYRGALKAVYREPSYFMLSGGRTTKYARQVSMLSDAACLLFEAKIAPAGWCLFSLSSWKAMEHTKRPPMVKWVFSCERFESQREWYESERTRWARRIERPVREHVELVDRWKRMWADLLRKRPDDRPRLLAVIDEHFPGESFERAIERAQGAARAAQIRIDKRIAAGEIPWTA